MKYFALLFLIVSISCCTLNSAQEKSLQQALNEYIAVHNDGKVTGFASLTHPSVLKYYTKLGDDAFSQKFELIDTSYNSTLWQDAIIRSTKKNDKKIHVLYLVKEFSNNKEMELGTVNIVAISEDDGVNWSFLEERDYRNDDIWAEEERLL